MRSAQQVLFPITLQVTEYTCTCMQTPTHGPHKGTGFECECACCVLIVDEIEQQGPAAWRIEMAELCEAVMVARYAKGDVMGSLRSQVQSINYREIAAMSAMPH